MILNFYITNLVYLFKNMYDDNNIFFQLLDDQSKLN